MTKTDPAKLFSDIHRCTLCSGVLPHAPRPVVQLHAEAKIVIVGQAPGIKAHESHQPWNDASGDKLRLWLGVNRSAFYSSLFTHLPMAFCFPGYKNGADAPPPKICSATWHKPVLDQLSPELMIHIGRYSQQYYFPEYKTLTDAVEQTASSGSDAMVLPHPSGRNNRWLVKNPWFEKRVLPLLREKVAAILA